MPGSTPETVGLRSHGLEMVWNLCQVTKKPKLSVHSFLASRCCYWVGCLPLKGDSKLVRQLCRIALHISMYIV